MKAIRILYETRLESFFDSAPFHLLTTATMKEFSRTQPESDFDQARFRPNFLVEVDAEGFIENNWVGQNIMLGESRFQVPEKMQRCIMTSRAQGDLAA